MPAPALTRLARCRLPLKSCETLLARDFFSIFHWTRGNQTYKRMSPATALVWAALAAGAGTGGGFILSTRPVAAGLRCGPARVLTPGRARLSVVNSSQAAAEIGDLSRPPEALQDVVYNFAFGSNLNPDKRSSRGVNGTGVVAQQCFPAVVKGYRLAFNLPMFPPMEPGMAALAPAREGEADACHGLLLQLSNDEYQKMWASEGGNAARPPYEETVVPAPHTHRLYASLVSLFLSCTHAHAHAHAHAHLHSCRS